MNCSPLPDRGGREERNVPRSVSCPVSLTGIPLRAGSQTRAPHRGPSRSSPPPADRGARSRHRARMDGETVSARRSLVQRLGAGPFDAVATLGASVGGVRSLGGCSSTASVSDVFSVSRGLQALLLHVAREPGPPPPATTLSSASRAAYWSRTLGCSRSARPSAAACSRARRLAVAPTADSRSGRSPRPDRTAPEGRCGRMDATAASGSSALTWMIGTSKPFARSLE